MCRKFLLQNFAIPGDETRMLEDRLLVEHNNVPVWEPRPIKITARHVDLYTIAHDTEESDALEISFEETFETSLRRRRIPHIHNGPIMLWGPLGWRVSAAKSDPR